MVEYFNSKGNTAIKNIPNIVKQMNIFKDRFFDAEELCNFKDRFVVPWFYFTIPYCIRYLIWTCFMTGYLTLTMCLHYIENILARITPLWLEARFYHLKASYLELLRLLGDKVNELGVT